VAVVAEHRTEGLWAGAGRPGRWGSEAQGSHCREGDAGQNVLLGGTMGDTLRPPTLSTTLQRLAPQAIQEPALVFTTLADLMDVDGLREAYRRTRQEAAPGSEGVRAAASAEHLEANLIDLYERLRSGGYTAPPVKRTWLDKEDGRQRPIGMPTFAAKSVQRAVTMLMGAV
jgi:RNA-directed DNA polymerase